MQYTKWIVIALAIGLTAAVAGCQQTQEVGKSARGLFAGEMETTFDRTPDQVSQAIVATEKDLKLVRISESKEVDDGQDEWTVVLRSPSDVKVEIVYTKLSERFTEIEISTGPFGDSDLRQSIYDTMRSKLGLLPSSSSQASADWSAPNGE
jgi:hypothetical protein